MNHMHSPWAPIQQANGVSCLHPTIVSDTGAVLTVAWQGDVPSTNRLIEQLCAVPELVAALRELIEAPEGLDINSFTLRRLAHARARAALAKLED